MRRPTACWLAVVILAQAVLLIHAVEHAGAYEHHHCVACHAADQLGHAVATAATLTVHAHRPSAPAGAVPAACPQTHLHSARARAPPPATT